MGGWVYVREGEEMGRFWWPSAWAKYQEWREGNDGRSRCLLAGQSVCEAKSILSEPEESCYPPPGF